MFTQLGPFVVIQAGTLELAVIQRKAERMEQMQTAAGIGAKAYDIAGVGRNLRLIQDNMKHFNWPRKHTDGHRMIKQCSGFFRVLPWL